MKLGVRAAIDTRIPIQYLHFQIAPGATLTQPMPSEFNAFAYVLGGQAAGPNGNSVTEHNLILFAQDGDEVELKAAEGGAAPLNVLLLAGVPIREPIARWGPSVMNSKAEIMQAMNDYQSGRMGRIER